MILFDANILVGVHRSDHPHHDIVRPWFDGVVAEGEPFGVPGFVWGSYVRVSTSSRIFTVPTPLEDAFHFVRAVTGQPQYVAVSPGDRHLAIFEQLCREGDATGDLAADAYLAAFAVEYGCALASLDRDFARFRSLTWIRPGE